MKPSRLARLFALPAILAFTSLAAHADTFDWTLTGPPTADGGFSLIGTGTLTATAPTSGDAWHITAITGTAGGDSITGLISYEYSDNLLFPTSTLLDDNGLSFSLSDGTDVNVYSFYDPGSTGIVPGNNNYGELVSSGAYGVGIFAISAPLSVAATPEPSTFVMLGTGLLGAAGALRRKLVRA
jgi:hypothetical protein